MFGSLVPQEPDFPGDGEEEEDMRLSVHCQLQNGSRRILKAICTMAHPSDEQKQFTSVTFRPVFPTVDYQRVKTALEKYSTTGKKATAESMLGLMDNLAVYASCVLTNCLGTLA